MKKLNVINRENDRMSGRRPIEFIQAAMPIVIIDEPQSVDNTEKSRRAIGNLNPMATLRYSATHKNPYNLLYKLHQFSQTIYQVWYEDGHQILFWDISELNSKINKRLHLV